MIARIIASAAVASGILSIVTLGMGQFGFPYMGFLAGMAASLKSINAQSPWLMLALPLLCIGVMILFVGMILFTNGILIVRAVGTVRPVFIRRLECWSALALSLAMILGLFLLRSFPGEQEIPVTFSDSYFIYPTLLMIVAATLRIMDTQAEQAAT